MWSYFGLGYSDGSHGQRSVKRLALQREAAGIAPATTRMTREAKSGGETKVNPANGVGTYSIAPDRCIVDGTTVHRRLELMKKTGKPGQYKPCQGTCPPCSGVDA